MSSTEEEMRCSRKDCLVIVGAALEAALDAAIVAQARRHMVSKLMHTEARFKPPRRSE
jgi:hypothetical protein